MLIYFDESYDNEHRYLILGALFNPHPKFLHREFLELKKKHSFIDKNGNATEIKYSMCNSGGRQKLCCGAIDIFIKSTSYFRAIVIDQKVMDLDYFGTRNEDERIKSARAYKKFAELLLSHNSEDIYNGVLLTDELKRCRGDEFLEIMRNDFCIADKGHSIDKSKPTLRSISEIKSHIENYHVNQINDILIGCILNNLLPTKNRHKNNIRNYLINRLGVESLLPEAWVNYSKSSLEKRFPKYNIWYWKPQKGLK